MNRPWGLIYSLSALVVLLALLLVFVLRLNSEREMNREEATASFALLLEELAELDELDELGQRLDQYFATVSTVEVLALYFPDQGMVFLRAREPSILRLSTERIAEFRGFPSYEYSEISRIAERSGVDSRQFEDLYIDAIFSVLDYHDVYPPLRDTLIALLGFALLLVVLAIATTHTGNLEAAARNQEPHGTEADAPERTPVSDRAPLIIPETHAEQSGGDDTEVIEVEEVTADDAEPGTIFEPATGLSFEDHLERKLGLELDRAAYNDQDLSCMIVAFEGDATPESRSRWARHILDAFQFEDLCFAQGSNRFCVVLPNTELPQAIRQAIEFQARYNSEAIGLSARNGRLVEAARVLKEAQRSLEHARTQPSRVVGFRPDPKKYRQFLSDNPT